MTVERQQAAAQATAPKEHIMIDRRFSLLGVIGGLMAADNLGDVAEEINHLCDLAGIPHPEGDFVHGWTDRDWRNVRQEP